MTYYDQLINKGKIQGIEECLEKGLEKGKIEGIEEGLEKIVLNAFINGFDLETIRLISGERMEKNRSIVKKNNKLK